MCAKRSPRGATTSSGHPTPSRASRRSATSTSVRPPRRPPGHGPTRPSRSPAPSPGWPARAGLDRRQFRCDDAPGVFAGHGIGDIWGAIATAIFAMQVFGDGSPVSLGLDPNVAGPLQDISVVDGKFELLWANVRAVGATMAYSFLATLLILKVLDLVPGLGLRADPEEEDAGLDISHHGERAYVSDGAD